MVLLKARDEAGFVFYTNLNSVKGRSIGARPRASLTFHWQALARQVRIQGDVERVGDADADAYFATRPRGSQLGAWASEQSDPIESREVLLARGPFSVEDELRLLRDRRIDVVVTKDSGGAATAAKLTAARELGVPVIVVRRPPAPYGVDVVGDVAGAVAWVRAL